MLWFSLYMGTRSGYFSAVMHLKNLTMLGFKSFADKTSLSFQPGVAAIVGPNGCGKSNVSDAIRWVLGEQSAKALRGGEMADVIFNGTDGRKPVGMAEVSLTVGGVDGDQLRASGVDVTFNEVTVTRRVFRDGGSEYFINRTPSRLKDIQQLFMGTGMGRTSYSIMAQGNITQLLSSKPEDRRLVFEEAAGITRFKAQKKEALRKLEYTDQNLLRVEDLIKEVKRQIVSLQRQAGKARRYKQLMMELQHLDTQLARHQYDVLRTEIRERETLADELRAGIENCSQDLLRREDEITQLRQRLSELERQISNSQQQGLELKGQIERHENRINFNDERIRELTAQHDRAVSDIAEASERRLIAEQELASVSERLTVSMDKLDEVRRTQEERRQVLQEVENQLRGRQEGLRQAQSELFSAAQQLSRVRNELTALDLQKQGNVIRLEKLSAEKIQLEEERARLEGRLSEFAASVEAEKVNVQTQRGTVEQRQQRLREIHQELNVIIQELDGLVRRQAGSKSQLGVLEQLVESHEGFSAGTIAALKQTQTVLGSLADRIRVPDQYITSVEAALGHHLQLVLTEYPEHAHQILADLNANRKGRASIAALALIAAHAAKAAARAPLTPSCATDATAPAEAVLDAAIAPTPSPTSDPAASFQATGHVKALSIIQAEESVQPLLDSLLGQTLIVPDLATATAAYRDCAGAFDFVTQSGEMLSRHGVFTGGSATDTSKGPSSILGRKNQIDGLQTQLAALQEQISEISRRKGGLQAEQTELQASLQEAQSELRQQEVAIATHEGEFRALENSLRVLHQKIDTVVYEVDTLRSQEQEGLNRRNGLAEQVQQQEGRERNLQEQFNELTVSLDGLRQQRDNATASLTEAKVSLAGEEQLCASLAKQRGPLEQRMVELAQVVTQRQSEIEGIAGRKALAETEVQESRRQIERLHGEREVVSNLTAELQGQKSSQASDISFREEALREQRKQHTDLQQHRGQLDVELAQKNMAVQNLRDRVQQKYQVSLDAIQSECITITFADEGPAKVETLSPEDMAKAGLATDWNVIGEQVAALQLKLDEIGPVNLVAIEEYEETEERFKFLSTQHDDLAQAKTQLMDVLNRINTQTREMFLETFTRIRENFQNMFIEVFGGGKADLRLVDENDVLESGIEIMARPPGKQLQSISLLSGGEQTMTAVALLFSIYQVKPSPFCVLDELDAPLDESNINRFIRILQRFLTNSQFIIITHNKRTIGMADVLYGITMQEHGVSKVVSVKFHKTDDQVTDHRPATLETPVNGPSVDAEEDKLKTKEETIDVVMAK